MIKTNWSGKIGVTFCHPKEHKSSMHPRCTLLLSVFMDFLRRDGHVSEHNNTSESGSGS